MIMSTKDELRNQGLSVLLPLQQKLPPTVVVPIISNPKHPIIIPPVKLLICYQKDSSVALSWITPRIWTNVYYKNVCLGKSFSGEGLDSAKHEITFSLNNGHLFEHRKPLKKEKPRRRLMNNISMVIGFCRK
ncbi:hypothetical protein L5515_017473 [Caenorhabditis briggsae]|uniref:Uncharacterized protein n=1 Tax=Caenorhabditis briggsae TaxID=6238 RepID=A0AAE9JQW5_CAEBR|nr:hypothetical protein L5515_017473 [Caenorhabditis briggsae]